MKFIWELAVPEMGEEFTRYCLTKEKALNLLDRMAHTNGWINFECIEDSDYYQEYTFEDSCLKFSLETYAIIQRHLISE